MKKLTMLFAAMAALVSWNLSAVAPTDFKMKLPITVNAEAVGEQSATDLPVLVRLSTSIDGFQYSDFESDGSDLAFGVDDGETITVYPHEIDTWNPTGESLVWVKVPTVAAGTTFNAYYGNGVSVASTATSVWSGYKGVWHMNEASGNALDATGNELDAVPTKNSGYSGDPLADMVGTDGLFGKARINATDAAQKRTYLSVPAYHMTDASKFTISGWFRMTNPKSGYARLFSSKKAYNDKYGFEIECAQSSATKISPRGASQTAPSVTIPDLTVDWVHLTFVYDSTTVYVYANGALAGSGAVAAPNEQYTLSIGSNTDGSEWSLYGKYDEVRLADGADSADRVGIEYAAMGNAEFLAIGAAQALDATMPKFSSMLVTANATAGFDVSVALADGSGTLKAVLVDIEDEQSSFEADFNGGAVVSEPGVYTTTVTGMAAGHTYAGWIRGMSIGSNPLSRFVVNVYNGTIKIEKVNDADETDMSSGFFKVSLVDAAATAGTDVTVAYTIGGTAVAGETYEEIEETVTIPAGESEALIEIKPIYTAEIEEDVDVVLTLDPGPYQIGEPSSATVVVKNSSINPYVRYVSMTGDDGNNGFTIGSAKATLQAAVDSLAAVSADNDCTIYVAKGAYPQPKNDIFYCVYVRGRITITSTTGVASDVTISRGEGVSNVGIFSLENEGARLSKITVSGGQLCSNNDAKKGPLQGGGVNVLNGAVEDCVVTGCVGPGYGQSGVGIYVAQGRVSRCRILNCSSNNDEANGTGVYVVNGALLEDSLVANCSCKNGGAVLVQGGGKVVNCTIVKNTGTRCAGVRVTANTAQIVNCAIFGNTQVHTQTGNVYTEGYGSCFFNCVADEEIVGGNNCIVSTPAFRDWENGNYCPTAGSPCLDAGALRSTYGCVSETDLDGNPRTAGTVDIGCLENQKDVEEVGFDWSTDRFVLPAKVSFVADAIGIDSPSYVWTFHNDTTGEESSGSGASCKLDLAVEDAGTYTFSVTAGGKNFVSPTKLLVSQPALYVSSANAGATFPFATEETAAATIADAVAAAGIGATVYVAPGEYPISSPIEVYKGISVLGTGSKYTDVVVTNTVSGTQADKRIFKLQDKDAFIANLTMAGGISANANEGGNLYYYGKGGTVSNCLLTAGTVYAQYQQGGGAAYLTAGLLTHCEITKCNAIPSKNNACTRIVNVASGRISNCLIHDCDYRVGGENALRGAGSLVNIGGSAIMDNCTICDVVVSNASPVVYVGVVQGGFDKGAKIVNCAIFGKDQSGNEARAWDGGTAWGTPPTVCFRGCATREQIQITYEKTTQGMTGTYTADESNIVVDPVDCFQDFAGGDFRAKADGPLVNAGVTTGPEKSTFALAVPHVDFAGKPRVAGTAIDVGCYELQPKAGLRLILR